MDQIFGYILVFIATYIGETLAAFFGGGSFFIQPALIAIGIDPKISIANDVAAAAFASYGYLLSKSKRQTLVNDYKIYSPIILVMFPAILIGTFVGANALKIIPSDYILWGIIIIACIGLIKMIFDHVSEEKETDQEIDSSVSSPVKYWPLIMVISSLILGFYDGISGAGSGTLQILAFAMIFRMPMKNILMIAIIFSGISLTAAGINFYFLGLLEWRLLSLMIPAAFLAGFTASYIVEIVKERQLRQVFIVALSILLIYLISDQLWI